MGVVVVSPSSFAGWANRLPHCRISEMDSYWVRGREGILYNIVMVAP